MPPHLPETSSAIGSLVERFPRERTWLLPALDAVQRAAGHVGPEALAAIAAHLRAPLSEVWGVATHYPELRLESPGRHLVRVCTGVSCRLRGGLELLAESERRLGVRAGQTSAEGVRLEEMDCAFACAVAPVVESAHRYAGRVSARDLSALLAPRTAGAADPHAAPAAPHAGDGHAAVDGRPLAGAPPRLAPAAGSGSSGDPVARLDALARDAGPAPALVLAVGRGSCGDAVGARAVADALVAAGAEAVVSAGCNGMCWAAPAVEVVRDGQRQWTAGLVTPADAARLVAAARAGRVIDELRVDVTGLAGQRRLLLERCGLADPGDLGDAIRRGAYRALARALAAGDPESVIAEVRAGGLAGRGGAYFQTAVKWAGCRAARGAPKVVVVNAEEGEPGIFKDRHLIEGDPHALIEGALLAAFAAGASRALFYVHGEANLAAERLARALAHAEAAGLVGERVLGSALTVAVEIRRGLGGFVLGEETALLESIEGRRAMPRTRPPFPVESGLYGLPTVINNVETLCAVPRIVGAGGAAFAALGGGHGTKLFGLSGRLARPGVVEVELGGTLRALIHGLGGGGLDGAPVRAAVVGGPSGSVIHPRDFDAPLVPRGPVNPGTGGVIALDEEAAVRDAVRTLLAFNTRESCGKCTPCREGTERLLALLDAPSVDGEAARALSEVVQTASLCGLGQAAPLAVLSGLRAFPAVFGAAPTPVSAP